MRGIARRESAEGDGCEEFRCFTSTRRAQTVTGATCDEEERRRRVGPPDRRHMRRTMPLREGCAAERRRGGGLLERAR